MSGLSTHVLDLARGVPAAGVALSLRWERGTLHGVTDADGRCRLIDGERLTLVRGAYGLDFAIADYFRGRGVAQEEPPFLDVVTIRFAVADPLRHHHVPLLVSPYGYSTYRGS